MPLPGDIDWSDSESKYKASFQVATAPIPTTTIDPGPTSLPRFRANVYENLVEMASPAAAAVIEQMELSHTAAGQEFEAILNSNPPPTSGPRFNAMEVQASDGLAICCCRTRTDGR